MRISDSQFRVSIAIRILFYIVPVVGLGACGTRLDSEQSSLRNGAANSPGEATRQSAAESGTNGALTTVDIDKLFGIWISCEFDYHNENLSLLSQIRVEILRVKRDEHDVVSYLSNSLPDYELLLFGRVDNDNEWQPFRLDHRGWIENVNGQIYFCFGPIGDHMRLRVLLVQGNLHLRGAPFDAIMCRQDQE